MKKISDKEFGGELLKKKRRKTRRPLDSNKSTHFILRLKQNLPNLFSPHNLKAKKGFIEVATKYNIRVYHLVFNHTHCHACLLIPSQKTYVDFVRELTARLTRYFSKMAKVKFSKIFLHRPYTRIVEWGRSFVSLLKYFEKNIKESGFPQPKPTTFASTTSAIQLSLNLFETG